MIQNCLICLAVALGLIILPILAFIVVKFAAAAWFRERQKFQDHINQNPPRKETDP